MCLESTHLMPVAFPFPSCDSQNLFHSHLHERSFHFFSLLKEPSCGFNCLYLFSLSLIFAFIIYFEFSLLFFSKPLKWNPSSRNLTTIFLSAYFPFFWWFSVARLGRVTYFTFTLSLCFLRSMFIHQILMFRVYWVKNQNPFLCGLRKRGVAQVGWQCVRGASPSEMELAAHLLKGLLEGSVCYLPKELFE